MVKENNQQTATEVMTQSMKAKHSNEHKLRELALNDVVMHQLFSAYDAGRYSSFEDFLTDTVLVMSSIKQSLHEVILEERLQQLSNPFTDNT